MAWYGNSWTFGWDPSLDDPHLDLLLYRAAKEENAKERERARSFQEVQKDLDERRRERLWKEAKERERATRKLTDEELAKEIRKANYWRAVARKREEEESAAAAFREKREREEEKKARQEYVEARRQDRMRWELWDDRGFRTALPPITQLELEEDLATIEALEEELYSESD